jgi:transposase
MEILEVVRRWQAGDSQRAIALATGLARMTVDKYLGLARAAGVQRDGPPPDEAILLQLGLRSRSGPPVGKQTTDRRVVLDSHEAQIRRWVEEDRLQLTRVQELLGRDGVAVPYTTLRRFVHAAQIGKAARSTVRVAESPPGEQAEMDFGKLGPLLDPTTGKRQTVWCLTLVLAFSRYSFAWPLIHQTLEDVIAGLEAAWRFFGGIPHRLVLDNFPAAVADPDPFTPRLTRGFLEYSQARGFLVDPARIGSPKDKPKVERSVPYVRERFWKGETFADVAAVRAGAEHWCREVAGQRIHGTTRRIPAVVFADEERSLLLPAPATPYDVPLWRELTVHPDHHISFAYALYSAPSTSCPPRTKLEVRGDRAFVRLYLRGELVAIHPRQSPGGRSTNPDHYPAERTAYALRAPDRLIRQATELGPSLGRFAEQLLTGTFPWAKLRQAQKLLRLADKYGAERLDQACARALAFDLVDVRRLERIVLLALAKEIGPLPLPGAGSTERLIVPPPGRFARAGTAFDHRHRPDPTASPVSSEER